MVGMTQETEQPVCPRCGATETHWLPQNDFDGNTRFKAALCDDCEVEIAFESAEDPGRPASAGYHVGKEV